MGHTHARSSVTRGKLGKCRCESQWGLRGFAAGQTGRVKAAGQSAQVWILDFEGKSYSPPSVGGWKTNVCFWVQRELEHEPHRLNGLSAVMWHLCTGDAMEDYLSLFKCQTSGRDTLFVSFGFLRTETSTSCKQTQKVSSALHPDDHRPRRPGARPYLRFRHHRLRGRAVGPPLDHHRHLPCRPGAGASPHHGRALSLVSCWPTVPDGQRKEAEI